MYNVSIIHKVLESVQMEDVSNCDPQTRRISINEELDTIKLNFHIS